MTLNGKRRGAGSLHNTNRLKLGIFSANCSGGMAITAVPERWQATWENNLTLARLCDDAGVEFLLPIARWCGYGGATDFQGESLETITWASGLLAATRRITVFGTVHAPLTHPVFAAKQMATVDQMSRGRFGLNIVCGWNADEFGMFGFELREHDTRYELGDEWIDLVKRIWSSKTPFDHDGRFFKNMRNVIGRPGPYQDASPAIMNAGASPRGQAFAARNCDFLFISLTGIEDGTAAVRRIRALPRPASAAPLGVFTTSYVVCRPTTREAEEYHDHYARQHEDTEAVDKMIATMGVETHTYPAEHYRQFRIRVAGGHGTYPLVGAPDEVAAELARISAAGFDGTTLAFVDYCAEFPYFRDEVLPRLERLGLRQPVARE